MMEADKVKQIKAWEREGKIKRLGAGSYSVPSEAFVMGITPRLVAEVLWQRLWENVKDLELFPGNKVRLTLQHPSGLQERDYAEFNGALHIENINWIAKAHQRDVLEVTFRSPVTCKVKRVPEFPDRYDFECKFKFSEGK